MPTALGGKIGLWNSRLCHLDELSFTHARTICFHLHLSVGGVLWTPALISVAPSECCGNNWMLVLSSVAFAHSSGVRRACPRLPISGCGRHFCGALAPRPF